MMITDCPKKFIGWALESDLAFQPVSVSAKAVSEMTMILNAVFTYLLSLHNMKQSRVMMPTH